MNKTIENQCERAVAAIEKIAAELGTDVRSAFRYVYNYSTAAHTAAGTAAHTAAGGRAHALSINNTTVNNNTSLNINKQVKRGEYEGGEIMGDTPQPPACVVTKKSTRFVKPTEQEVIDFCREKGYTKVNAADFIDYYESNGWMVGKNKMKDWKRTVSRWERMDQQGRGGNCAAGQAGNNGMPVGMILHTKKDVKASDYE